MLGCPSLRHSCLGFNCSQHATLVSRCLGACGCRAMWCSVKTRTIMKCLAWWPFRAVWFSWNLIVQLLFVQTTSLCESAASTNAISVILIWIFPWFNFLFVYHHVPFSWMHVNLVCFMGFTSLYILLSMEFVATG